MKKLIKKSVLIATMLTALVGSANEGSFYTFKNEPTKKVLIFNNVKQGHQLTIKDVFGVVLYKEMIKVSGKYSKPFDLISLPNGNYFFELNLLFMFLEPL